jgi:formiminoglutamase
MTPPPWLTVTRRDAPLIVSFPHTGTTIPTEIEARLVSAHRGRLDADWLIDTLYDFVRELGATTVHTAISRTVIDVNRDPLGVSLYPGQATTELVPTTTFDGKSLWRDGEAPDPAEIAERRAVYFDPYHAALSSEIARLRARFSRVVLYDCHSIRSVIPRLFDSELPIFNIGTNSGASCDPALERAVVGRAAASGMSHVVNGRFKGGYITRHHGRPADGVHAVQMELACRAYMREAVGDAFREAGWPSAFDPAYAAPVRAVLFDILTLCRDFALRGGP